MRKKRYLFITDQFQVGGVESVFINIANTLHQNIILLPVHRNLNSSLINSLPKNVKLLLPNYSFPRNFLGLLRCILMAMKLHKDFRNDNTIVINFSDTLTSMLVAFFINPTNCWSWIHCNPMELMHSKTYRLYWWLLGKCQRLIFLCESQRSLFFKLPVSKNIDKARSTVCTNFTRINRNTLENKQYTNMHIKISYFFTAARLDLRSKDFLTLIRGFSLLPPTIHNKYELLIAGEGPDKEKIQGFINRYKQQEYIKLIGNVENPYNYMKNSTLYLHSSISEGFSMAILEALSCGCTVVSSDCPVGPKEILDGGKFGYLYKMRDSRMLALRINQALINRVPSKLAIDRAKDISDLGQLQIKELFEDE